MKLIDLSGRWDVKIDDPITYHANLPGTLDENGIGHQDNNPNQWHPAEVSEEANQINALLRPSDVIKTRLTRAYSYEGSAVFSRELVFREEFKENRVFLEIERSRKLALRMNGDEITPYCSGTVSTPYIFEITNRLEDHNTIELASDNSYHNWPHDGIVYSSAATDETQTNWNGILGFLRLRVENEVFLSKIMVYPHHNYITVIADIDAAVPYEGVLCFESPILEDNIEQRISIDAGIHTISLDDIKVKPDCKRWDEYEGYLTELSVSGSGLDRRTVSFGMRDFEDNGSGRFCLNGRVVFLRSETNCCVFPETGHMPLTVKEWLTILEVYKSYGVNCVRFHSHCPPESAFTAADQLGILMQPELSHWNPNTAFESEESFQYYQLELQQILLTLANHPSFVMLTLGNELQANELGHQRMDALLTLARSMDSTRLYANGSNIHYGAIGTDENSDFYTSSNYYDKMLRGTSSPMIGHINECYPNAKTNYDQVMRDLRKEYSGPVFSFEVGQYEILPDFDEIADFIGVTVPNNLKHIKENVIQRGFDLDWKKRVEATGELAKITYREEIEAALRTRELSGISLLGLQDFPGQGTALVGMLNSHLNPKPYAFAQPEAFRGFFREVLPLVLLEKYTYTNQETLAADIEIANYGKKALLAPTTYELISGNEIIASGSFAAKTVPYGEVTVIGRLEIPLKNVMTVKKLTLIVSIGEDKNEYPIWVYPDYKVYLDHQDYPDHPIVNLVDPEYSVDAHYLANIRNEVVITKTLSETKLKLAEGKRVFYSPMAEEEHFPNSVPSQFTTDFWSVGTFANQSGCMGCLIDASHSVFTDFPTETHSNWQWWPMTNGRAMMIPDEVEPIVTVMDCYARLRRMGFLFECKVGTGKLMVSSMGLMEKHKYPEVRALIHSIFHYMNSDEFNPEQEVSLDQLCTVIS